MSIMHTILSILPFSHWLQHSNVIFHDIYDILLTLQLTKEDFNHYDYIFGMDHGNISDIKARAPKTYTAKIELFGSYDPKKELIIRDPYYVSLPCIPL